MTRASKKLNLKPNRIPKPNESLSNNSKQITTLKSNVIQPSDGNENKLTSRRKSTGSAIPIRSAKSARYREQIHSVDSDESTYMPSESTQQVNFDSIVATPFCFMGKQQPNAKELQQKLSTRYQSVKKYNYISDDSD